MNNRITTKKIASLRTIINNCIAIYAEKKQPSSYKFLDLIWLVKFSVQFNSYNRNFSNLFYRSVNPKYA